MQRIMTHLNLPMPVAPYSYNNILKNIAHNSSENAEESIDKASRISMCRKDDIHNNVIFTIMMRVITFTLKNANKM